VFSSGIAFCGFYIRKTAKHSEALSREYKEYLIAIVKHNCYNIEGLATALDVSYGTALQKVEEMVDLGLFQGAFTDYNTKELVWGERYITEFVTRPCSSCGANCDIVAGRDNKCRYCGTSLRI
jgi:hypothetical protein